MSPSSPLFPLIALVAVAGVLLLLGAFRRRAANGAAPLIAVLTLLVLTGLQLGPTPRPADAENGTATIVAGDTLRTGDMSHYVQILTCVMGAVLLLLAWPIKDRDGNATLHFGDSGAEFFALALLSLAGVYLVATANDLIVLFLGLELVSLPTYVMVATSRPLAVAQEAGVKYFFLGAMAAALMLFGFSYLYGSTGFVKISQITLMFRASAGGVGHVPELTSWQLLAVILLIVGFAFKIAAVPLHYYVGDVYEGAATPVTAFLAFVPKTAGFVALIKILHMAGGGSWLLPPVLVKLLWVLAVLTMTVGNVLALRQQNVKRVLAYSSVAHSGYILAGLAAATGAWPIMVRASGLVGVLFYLAAYGLMTIGAFGVLCLLPSRGGQPATTAETYDDLTGQGRQHTGLGLAMAVSCFSLIGIPLTVGFIGKFFLIKPMLQGGLTWLAIIMVVNAAISAGYYLRIVATMFMRTPVPETASPPGEAEQEPAGPALPHAPLAISLAVVLATVGTVFFGTLPPATQLLINIAQQSTQVDPQVEGETMAAE